jgi:DNA-binding transcriptional LysR family regulator
VDIRQLRYFVVLAEELHFGRAAAKLHIAQPALSQQIKAVEAELGLRLLERTSRGVALTDAGARFLTESRSVLARFDEAAETMQKVKDGAVASLRVGVSPGPLRTLLPAVLVELRRQRPGVDVETRYIPTDEQLTALLDSRLEVALLPDLGQLQVAPPLAAMVVGGEPLGIAVPAAHRLAEKDRLDAADLAPLPLVFMARAGAPRIYDTVLAALRAAGVQPRSVLEASTPQSSLAIVAAGLAVSVKAQSEVDAAQEAVAWKTLANFDLEVAIVAAWDTRHVTPALRLLLDLLADKSPFSGEKAPVLDTDAPALFTGRVTETGGTNGD